MSPYEMMLVWKNMFMNARDQYPDVNAQMSQTPNMNGQMLLYPNMNDQLPQLPNQPLANMNNQFPQQPNMNNQPFL